MSSPIANAIPIVIDILIASMLMCSSLWLSEFGFNSFGLSVKPTTTSSMSERNSFRTRLLSRDKNIQNFKNSVAKVWVDIVRRSELKKRGFRTRQIRYTLCNMLPRVALLKAHAIYLSLW